MNAAQRARKRWRREHGGVPEDSIGRPIPPARPQFHRLHMPTKESAESAAENLRARGRIAEVIHRPSFQPFGGGELPWCVKASASAAEIRDPGYFYDVYQTLADKLGGEYGGCA